ncbi:MAG: hypothetical protein HY958_11425 [Bacteroidia bacterium]|nr:hypothetical protein [Bacteroidia bacterium]
MQTLIVKVDTAANAGLLASFLKTIPYIASVKEDLPASLPRLVGGRQGKKQKPLTAEDWCKPSARPATDEEIEQMIAECEASPFVTTEELRKNVTKRFKKCKM